MFFSGSTRWCIFGFRAIIGQAVSEAVETLALVRTLRSLVIVMDATMWGVNDITSQRYLDLSQTPPVFDVRILPIVPKGERRGIAESIRIG